MITNIRGSLLARAIRRQPEIDFAVIGFPKCATTSLHATFMSANEVHMPDYEVQIKALRNGSVNLKTDKNKIGIKNPNLIYEPHNINALIKANKNIKFLVGLRNPVNFLFSFYQYRKLEIRENKAWLFNHVKPQSESLNISFKDIVMNNKELLGVNLEAGNYVSHLKKLLKMMKPENIMVFFVEELYEDNLGVYTRIMDFLNIDSSSIGEPKKKNIKNSMYESKDKYSDEIAFLNEYYRERNNELYKLLYENWGLPRLYW